MIQKVQYYIHSWGVKDSAAITLIVSTFIILALYMASQMGHSNETWFYAINHLSNHYLSSVFLAHLTDIGNGSVCATIAIVICVKQPKLFKRILLTVLITALMSTLLKILWDLPRPAAVLDRSSFDIIGAIVTKHSFPSGHTMTAFSVAGFIILSIRNYKVQVIAIILAFMVGVSRIAVGAHWPEDIAAGAAFGLLSSYLAFGISSVPFTPKNSYRTGFALCLLSVLGILLERDDFPNINSISYLRYTIVAFSICLAFYFLASSRKAN
jgi:membrane-associated phospholipid phosphatase